MWSELCWSLIMAVSTPSTVRRQRKYLPALSFQHFQVRNTFMGSKNFSVCQSMLMGMTCFMIIMIAIDGDDIPVMITTTTTTMTMKTTLIIPFVVKTRFSISVAQNLNNIKLNYLMLIKKHWSILIKLINIFLSLNTINLMWESDRYCVNVESKFKVLWCYQIKNRIVLWPLLSFGLKATL